jgi:hypothetical protein
LDVGTEFGFDHTLQRYVFHLDVAVQLVIILAVRIDQNRFSPEWHEIRRTEDSSLS